MTTRRSDKKPSVAILRRVAVMAVRDARAAWSKAHKSPSETTVRAAFRSCVLAVRSLRKAAAVSPRDAEQMLDEATRIDAAGNEMKNRLVRMK